MKKKANCFWWRVVLWGLIVMMGLKVEAGKFYAASAFYSFGSKCIYINFEGTNNIRITDECMSITPALKNCKILRDDVYKNSVYYQVNGDFQPGIFYKLELTTNIKNGDGEKMAAPASFLIKVPSLSPKCQLLVEGTVMPLHRPDKSLPLELTNLEGLKVEVKKIYRNNLIDFSDSNRYLERYARKIEEKDIRVTMPENTREKARLMLSSLFPVDKPGLYHLSLEGRSKNMEDDCNRYRRESIVILTDLAVTGVVEDQGTKAVVLVSRFSTNKAVEGAKVTLVSTKNQRVATGVTDAAGMVRLSVDAHFASTEENILLAVVEKDDDFGILKIRDRDGYERYFEDNDYEHCGADVVTMGPAAFVYTERGVARPGEKIICSAFVRQRTEKDIKPCDDFPCVLTLSGPLAGVITRKKVKTDAYGFVTQEFTLPDDGLTGTYELKCEIEDGRTIGSTNFLVAVYRPDRIKVTQTLSTPVVKPGEKFSSTVEANYYFGQPVEEGEVRLTFMSKPLDTPKHWQGWTVGTKDEAEKIQKIGQLNFPLKNGKGEAENCHWTSSNTFYPLQIMLAAQVTVDGEPTVTNTTTMIGNPTELYLGLHDPEYDRVADSVNMEYKIVRLAQDDVLVKPFGAVTITLKRILWNYNLVKNKFDVWHYEWEENKDDFVEPFTVQLTDVEGKVTLPKLVSGHYELIAEIDDTHKTVLNFWYYQGEAGRRTSDPGHLTFETDKEIYNPGDTAVLSFDVAGNGYAFAVSGESGIQEEQSIAVKDGRNELRVKIPEWIPTEQYYCGVTVVTDMKPLFVGFNVAALKIRQVAHKLKVDIQAPQVARPQKPVELEVRLSDEHGKAQSGGVHVYLVDEGILALTGYNVPDIFSYFYGKRSCDMRFCNLYKELYPEVDLDGAMKIGGDDVSAMKSKIADLAMADPAVVSLGMVTVPDSGVAKITATIPDHQGAMRVMCVASNAQRVGMAEQSMIVRDEIGVLVSSPRVVAPGDEFTVHFLVSHMEHPGADMKCNIHPSEGLKRLGATDGTVKEISNISKQFDVRFQAQESLGIHKLEYVITMGNLKKTGEVSVAIRSLNPPVTVQNTLVLKPGESKTLELNQQDWLTDSAAATVTVSKSQFTRLVNALEWLNEYPYGCLEQTTSRALPLLFASHLKNAGIITEAAVAMQRPKLEAAYRAILPMYLGKGRFSLWPESTVEFTDGVFYAGYFLFLMDRRYPGVVSADMLKAVEACLLRTFEDDDVDVKKRAFACYISSLRKQKTQNASALASYARLLPKKNTYDMTLLLSGAALVNLGYAAEGAKLVREALQHDIWLEKGALFALADNVSRAGLCLMIGMEVCPESKELPLLANWLMSQMRKDGSGWGTTQRNAWATSGLACYCSEQNGRNGKIRVAVNGGAATEDQLAHNLVYALKGNDKVEVTNVGDTPVFIEMRTQGNPRNLQTTANDKLSITRVYLNQDNEPANHFAHGDLVTVQLTVTCDINLENVVIVDMLPGCLEIEDDNLMTRLKAFETMGFDIHDYIPRHCEKRDDRFIAVGDLMNRKEYVIRYHARVVMPGTYMAPPAIIEAMYDPEFHSVFAEHGKIVAE